MSIVQDLMNAALRSIGVLGSGETPSTEENADAFSAINLLIASLSARGISIPQITRSTVNLFGSASYSLPARPLKIKSAEISTSGFTLPVKVVNAEEWSTGGGTAAMPFLFCDHGYPTSLIYLRPGGSGGVLELNTLQKLAVFATVNDQVNLPDGYERAIMLKLAVDLALQFGRPIDPNLIADATEALGAIEGLNAANLGPASLPAA